MGYESAPRGAVNTRVRAQRARVIWDKLLACPGSDERLAILSSVIVALCEHDEVELERLFELCRVADVAIKVGGLLPVPSGRDGGEAA